MEKRIEEKEARSYRIDPSGKISIIQKAIKSFIMSLRDSMNTP